MYLTESEKLTLEYLLKQDYDLVTERIKLGESANIYSMAYKQLPFFKVMQKDIETIQEKLKK